MLVQRRGKGLGDFGPRVLDEDGVRWANVSHVKTGLHQMDDPEVCALLVALGLGLLGPALGLLGALGRLRVVQRLVEVNEAETYEPSDRKEPSLVRQKRAKEKRKGKRDRKKERNEEGN
eukprot:scaffold99203_cov30-Prasinocladus_malaysianus.AAC.1